MHLTQGWNELYHIAQDPYELHDRIDKHPEKAQEMFEQMKSFMRTMDHERALRGMGSSATNVSESDVVLIDL